MGFGTWVESQIRRVSPVKAMVKVAIMATFSHQFFLFSDIF